MQQEVPDGRKAPRLVVIAASAGGIRALLTIVAALPRGFPASIVVVQHRTPAKPSLIVPILARVSALPVEEARGGDALKAGTIYIAKPDQHLTIDVHRTFHYTNGHRIRHLLSSANPLFASSALVFGPRATAVVLTGSGMDATDGVQTIKAHGGMVIAQDRATSEHFGMPGAAIQTGAVDLVVPLEDIAPTLVRLVARQHDEAPEPAA